MILLPITELSIVGVFDRGVPNNERIVISAVRDVNMGQYGVMLGIRAEPGWAIPIPDNFFWFGDGLVSKGDMLFLYTGPGDPRVSELPSLKIKTYVLHWGRKQTILTLPDIVPILCRLDAVFVHTEPPAALPQKAAGVRKGLLSG